MTGFLRRRWPEILLVLGIGLFGAVALSGLLS